MELTTSDLFSELGSPTQTSPSPDRSHPWQQRGYPVCEPYPPLKGLHNDINLLGNKEWYFKTGYYTTMHVLLQPQ